MNEFKLLPDDPKLTAYALGELDGDERAAVEAALRDNPALGAIVDDIRAMAAELETALAGETMAPAPTAAAAPAVAGRREQVATRGPAAGAAPAPAGAAGDPYAKRPTSKLLQFPQVYYLVGGLAAACFAVVAALRPTPPAPVREMKHYVEMPLAPLDTDADKAAEEESVPAVAPSPAAGRPDTALTEAQRARMADMGAAFAAKPELPAKQPGLLESPPNRVVLSGNTSPTAKAEGGSSVPLAYTAAAPQLAVTTGSVGGVIWSAGSGPTSGGHAADALAFKSLPGRRVAMKLAAAGKSREALDAMQAAYDAAAASGSDGRTAANTEGYAYLADNAFLAVAQNPLSTFSADVDTASYANVRRFLMAGKRPPVDAVRIEELLNYFPYKYATPTAKDPVPFAATMEIAEAPWATNHRLVRIGLKGREVSTAERGAANLVFLLDVSGSMNQPNKLPLVKESLHLLLGRLRPDDRVAIVVYAGATGLALPSTPVKHAREIAAAIDELTPGGSTNGAMGIQLAYDIAKANFIEGGINRVVLCTDGDFNVGVTSQGELVRLITEKAKSKVFLTALGFGMGNYKDATLQQIADAGNGNYGYVDTRREAEKLLVEQVNGTLVTIAKDVKLQVEFNPAKVASYRLIGYEKRLLKKEDFNNDQVDAGEIGAGHAVTALYEIVPVGEENAAKGTAGEPPVDELRYVAFASAPMTIRPSRPEVADEWLTLKVRYKEPAGETSKRLEFPLADRGATFAAASADFKFAAAVAGFGMILRDSLHRGAATLADVENWADAGIGADPGGYRAEFVGLVKRARRME